MAQSPRLGPYKYKPTFSVAVSDTAQYLDDDLTLIQPSGDSNRAAQYALIQVRDNDILWNHSPSGDDDSDTPDQADDGPDYVTAAGGTIILNGEDAIAGFCFINKTNGSNARLVVTLGF